MMTEKEIHVKHLMGEVCRMGLFHNEQMELESFRVMAQEYNGCGADWFPEYLRSLLTELLEWGEPAFLIHDWDYSNLPKTEANFYLSNDRLYENLLVCAKDSSGGWKHPWLWWRRRRRAWECYTACLMSKDTFMK